MYESPTRSTLRTGLVVGAIHVGIGAALLSTFAGGVITEVIHKALPAANWAYVPPPPPHPQPDRVAHAAAPSHDAVAAPQPALPGLAQPTDIALGELLPMQPGAGKGDGFLTDFTPEPHPTPTFAPVAARPLGDRGAWITTDDYPSRALREGWSGVTRLHLLIGSDGRVESCSVAASSGHPELDTVACAKVTERARFSPAHDSSGAAGAGTYDGAIRWRINEVPGD
ncbi:energy transducer TonB [Novosphingobium sp.]|uniref:energy transducer TonB n=1 Tax=Novosphingobium sp. TaxID=1874826 RepID=UPI003B51843A